MPIPRRVPVWLVRALVVSVLLCGRGSAFTLTDHAVKAFIRPCKRIAAFEAEGFAGVPRGAVVADKLAANGKAVRLKALEPRLTFRRRLERGTYSVWCVGRTEKRPSRYRESVYVHLYVRGPSKGPGRSTSRQWRMRINYMAGAYQDVAHLYFDANAPGEYEVTFCLGHDSAFDLLVDRLELRDVLAGTWRKGFKTEPTMFTDSAYARRKRRASAMYPREEALRRARDIAASLPPRNALLTSGGMPKKGFYQEFRLGAAKLTEPSADRWRWRMNENLETPWVMSGPTLPKLDELEALDGELERGEAAKRLGPARIKPQAGGAASRTFGKVPPDRPDLNWATGKPGPAGTFTAEDYHAFRKLPGRWPDDGGGYFTAGKNSGKMGHSFYFNILAGAFKARLAAMRGRIGELADRFYKTGDPRVGFVGAVMLAHFADHFPSIDHTVQGTMNATWGTYPFNNFTGRHAGSFGKLDYSGWAGPGNVPLMIAYDKLFPFIKGNQLLADAIGQTIPWVKTPQDVVELIDVKLVQHFFDVAERGHVRFASVRCNPVVAVVQGNNEAGVSMLRRVVHRSDFQFSSILDTFVAKRSRDSTSFIGSMYYAKAPSLNAGASVASISAFAEKYGLKDLYLASPARTTILFQAAQWLIEPYVVGVHVNGVGDVAGPQGYPTMTLESEGPQRVLYAAWRCYRDARFAWMLEHVYGFPPYAAKEAADQARAAAAGLPGDPRANQPSRVLGGFGVAILEVNGGHPDFRKRTGVVMRAGYGSGHGHADGLNLEIFSKGIVATAEFGGRPGYGTPPTTVAQSHCLVTIDGQIGTAKTSLLADLPGSPCMEAGFDQGRRGEGIAATRFVALIDAGQDDAYLFDVVRASGGRKRTYWFHGNQTAAIEAVRMKGSRSSLAVKVAEAEDDLGDLAEEEDKGKRPEFKWGQDAFSHNLRPEDKGVLPSDDYQAVWPLQRVMEQSILGRIRQIHPFARGKRPDRLYDPKSPKKFTRLILLASKGRRIRTVAAKSPQVQYRIICTGVTEEKRPEQASVFPALIEPFAGQAFVTGYRPLKVSPVGQGAPYAVSVEIRKGRQDLFYQSADAAARCRVAGARPFTASGRFAYVSCDAAGPRACSLVNGTEVTAECIGLRLERSRLQANIVSVDYVKREIRLDAALPASLLSHSTFLLGKAREPFRILHARRGEGGTVLHFQKTAETYRAPVFVVRGGREVVGPVEPEHRQTSGWLTNEKGDKGWPVTGVRIGSVRWMGASFRGGARMGGPISWDDVPDADHDGKRTLVIKKHSPWEEDMRVEVLAVDAEMRSFAFVPLNSPKGYRGTRSYARGDIVNEAGKHISIAVIPGKMGSFLLAEGALARMADFTDADGDGQAKFHVYHFGPGDPASVQTHAAALRQKDGTWLVTANAPVEVSLPCRRGARRRTAGGSWEAVRGAVRNGALTAKLPEEALAPGQVVLRVE